LIKKSRQSVSVAKQGFGRRICYLHFKCIDSKKFFDGWPLAFTIPNSWRTRSVRRISIDPTETNDQSGDLEAYESLRRINCSRNHDSIDLKQMSNRLVALGRDSAKKVD
jgi:hypothetical protein